METTHPPHKSASTGCPEMARLPVIGIGRPRLGLLALCGLAALLGCRQDEIQHYTAPKSEPLVLGSGQDEGPVRLLAAIVPHGDRTWFFKLTGPPTVVAEHKQEFDQFLGSVHFTDKAEPPVEWKVPEGWQEEPGNKVRYATFHIGPEDGPAELSVTSFEGQVGSLLANVNRWRGQIGLAEIKEDELGKLTSETKVDGGAATLVDMTGQGTGKGNKRMAPFLSANRGGGARPAAPLKYTTPPGWEEESNPAPPRVAAFRVSDGRRTAEVTVIPFPGEVGGLQANVDRWRRQVGLGPASDEDMKNDVRKVEVDGSAAAYADVTGPESAGRTRILGVVVPRGEQSWFFKMQGPADLLERQKAAFEAFVKSVHFEGGPGGKHE
jgi:hypothetical protein